MLGKKYSIGICFGRERRSKDLLACFATARNDAKPDCIPGGYYNKNNKAPRNYREKSIVALLSNCHANNDRNHSNTPAIFKYKDKLEHISNVWVCSLVEEGFFGLGKKADESDMHLYPGFLKLFKGRVS